MDDPRFGNEGDDLDYWRLCDELSVYEAALLVGGYSPAKFPGVENWNVERRPRGYEAAKTAITNALRARRIEGTVEPEHGSDINGNSYPIPDTFALSSRVEVASLKEWLAGRGFRQGFFLPQPVERSDYLDPSHPRYAPKLAAAVRAWLAVTDAPGRSPKQALVKWLCEHATEFGLTDEEGELNELGIEEAAKVANWQPGGGAPKTPGGQS